MGERWRTILGFLLSLVSISVERVVTERSYMALLLDLAYCLKKISSAKLSKLEFLESLIERREKKKQNHKLV